jgi:hypothetical protein
MGMISDFECPTWALNYIINGDYTGLTFEEVSMIESFIRHMDNFSTEGEEFFSYTPAFGLPCTCEKVSFMWVEDFRTGDWEGHSVNELD